jgi:hypothetical protein
MSSGVRLDDVGAGGDAEIPSRDNEVRGERAARNYLAFVTVAYCLLLGNRVEEMGNGT